MRGRYVATMSYVLGFVPWIAFFVIASANHPSRSTLVWAAAAGLFAALVLIVPAARQHRVSSLDVGGLVFFPVLGLLALVLPAEELGQWAPTLGQGALAAAVGLGVLVGRPFTLVYAKADTPEVLWTNPGFVAGNRRLALGWFVAFIAMTGASVVGSFFPLESWEAVVCFWVVPAAIMVITVRWQISEIAAMRAAGQERARQRQALVVAEGGPVVGWPDHLTVVLPPERMRSVAEGLHRLGLVQAWPLSGDDGFSSVGIRLGNLNLELASVDSSVVPLTSWLTFEPVSLRGLTDELDRRGLEHDSFDTVSAGGMDIYTRVGLPQLTSEHFCVQLCETFTPTSTVSPEAPRNSAGIVQVRDVELHVDRGRVAALAALVAPLDLGDELRFDRGPAVSVRSGGGFGLGAVTVEVHDTARATEALRGAGFDVAPDGDLSLGEVVVRLVRQPASGDTDPGHRVPVGAGAQVRPR